MTEEWLDFIADCRSGKDHEYDIVIGAMADDQIYNFVSDYIDGVITREQFWVNAIKTGKCFRNIIADQYKMRGLQRDVQSE